MQKIRQETEQEWAKQKVKCWLSSECFLMFLLLKTEEMACLDMNSIRQKRRNARKNNEQNNLKNKKYLNQPCCCWSLAELTAFCVSEWSGLGVLLWLENSCCWRLISCRQSLLLIVRLPVKVVEHVKEDGILSDGDGKPDHGIARLQAVEEDAVRAAHCKLQQLQLGDVLLPPEVLLHLRAKGRKRVVGVHYYLRLDNRQKF